MDAAFMQLRDMVEASMQ